MLIGVALFCCQRHASDQVDFPRNVRTIETASCAGAVQATCASMAAPQSIAELSPSEECIRAYVCGSYLVGS